jgi:DNA-binding Xre family transcriptional regulator
MILIFVWDNTHKIVSLYLSILQSGKVNQQMKAINRIKAVLAEKQVSGKWLAKEIGRTENTISRWCSNKVQPSLEDLVKVADVLEVDIRDLVRPTLNK